MNHIHYNKSGFFLSATCPKVQWCWSPISDFVNTTKPAECYSSSKITQSVLFSLFSLAQKIRKQADNFSFSVIHLAANFHNGNPVSYFRLGFVLRFFFLCFLLSLIPLTINLIKHTSALLSWWSKTLGFLCCSGTCHHAKLTDVPMKTQHLVHF